MTFLTHVFIYRLTCVFIAIAAPPDAYSGSTRRNSIDQSFTLYSAHLQGRLESNDDVMSAADLACIGLFVSIVICVASFPIGIWRYGATRKQRRRHFDVTHTWIQYLRSGAHCIRSPYLSLRCLCAWHTTAYDHAALLSGRRLQMKSIYEMYWSIRLLFLVQRVEF